MNAQTASEPRILKIATCPSLSGRASLTYHVGFRDERDLCFRIWDTSGKGIFSKEWVCAPEIQKVLGQHESLSAALLLPLFKVGRSINTAGFLLAALRNEGLVALDPEEAHKYVRVESQAFVAEMTELMKSGVSPDPGQVTAIRKTRRPGRVSPWHSEPQAGEPTQGA